MKTFGYISLAALLALASCTNEINEEGFVDKTKTISFNAYPNKTRTYTIGDINNATAMQDGSFGVVGYKSGSSIYLGSASKAVEQTWQSTAWGYANPTELKYWPDGTMDFYAYFPYAASGDAFASTNSAEGTVMTINNVTGDQDVLFASALNQSYQERVPLTFHHAFSKVKSVNIKVELNDVNVEVKKVEFINTTSSKNSQILVNKSGKASYGTATGETTSTCGHELSSSVAISTSSNADGYSVWDNNANKYLLATQGESNTYNVTGTNKAMWDGTKDGWNESDKLSTKGLVCLKITGKVTTHGGTNYIIGNASEDDVIYIPLKGTHANVGSNDQTSDLDNFFAGKRYTYNIVMSKNVGYKDNGDPILKPILFNVSSVDSWDDVTVTITL